MLLEFVFEGKILKKKLTVKTIIIILLTALLCGCVESNVSVEDETLKEADTIQFEWHDTRLYWKYIKDGNEEFGGCHEFN